MSANYHASIGLAFLAGNLSVLSPCILPILPITIGRSLQSHQYGPIALVTGLVTGFALVGSLLGFTSNWLTNIVSSLRYIAIALLFAIGLSSIFPKLSRIASINLNKFLPFARLKQPQRVGLAGEFWLGTQLGLLWTPCAGGILASILILAAVQHQVIQSFILLVAYGIGMGIPLLAIAYAGRYCTQSFLSLRLHSQTLQRIGGVLVAATAIAIYLGWDVEIQLWLASKGLGFDL